MSKQFARTTKSQFLLLPNAGRYLLREVECFVIENADFSSELFICFGNNKTICCNLFSIATTSRVLPNFPKYASCKMSPTIVGLDQKKQRRPKLAMFKQLLRQNIQAKSLSVIHSVYAEQKVTDKVKYVNLSAYAWSG